MHMDLSGTAQAWEDGRANRDMVFELSAFLWDSCPAVSNAGRPIDRKGAMAILIMYPDFYNKPSVTVGTFLDGIK